MGGTNYPAEQKDKRLKVLRERERTGEAMSNARRLPNGKLGREREREGKLSESGSAGEWQ